MDAITVCIQLICISMCSNWPREGRKEGGRDRERGRAEYALAGEYSGIL